MEWIKTSEKLPEQGIPVLGWDDYWEECHPYIYADLPEVDWCIASGIDYERMEKHETEWYPTYWMPLPNAPSK